MSFLQMKHWAQNLGAYLFTGTPGPAWNRSQEQALSLPLSHIHQSLDHHHNGALPAAATTPQLTILDGYICATTVDTQPQRLAWLLKLQLAIELELEQPLLVPMAQVNVLMQMPSLAGLAQLPSIYLQPPRKSYIPNASSRLQSLSPLIDGTDDELVIHGAGEFFLHASGGTPYFVGDPNSAIFVTVSLPLPFQQIQPLTIAFSPSAHVTPGVHLWALA